MEPLCKFIDDVKAALKLFLLRIDESKRYGLPECVVFLGVFLDVRLNGSNALASLLKTCI